MPRSSQEPTLCPCGVESLAHCGGMHAIGPSCRERVAWQVRKRFGRHRFGGRYATEVEDIIQECYRNLVAPGGLDTFEPADEGERADHFRRWLWVVVHHHCNNKVKYLSKRPDVGSGCKEHASEAEELITPEQAFARARIRELNRFAVRAVEPEWRNNDVKSERFDVVLSLLYERGGDTKSACERLRITPEHLGKLKSELRSDIRAEVRNQVFEELRFEPGRGEEAIELAIDQEIEALFQAAYPGRSVPLPLSEDADETSDESAKEEESNS